MGLIARALELNGVATTLTSWHAGRTRSTCPPRATLTGLQRGATLGSPHHAAQQRRVLEATLALLAHDTPLDPVYLDEKASWRCGHPVLSGCLSLDGAGTSGSVTYEPYQWKDHMGEKNGPPTHVCPKCEGPMEPGRLMGMKFTSFVADAEWAKPVGKAVRVTAYRCQRCGYCEIYAQGSP